MSFDATTPVKTKTIEVDVGFGNHTAPSTLIVVDSDITASSTVVAVQSGEAPTGKSADENEFDHFTVTALVSPSGGSMTLILRPMPSMILGGTYKINYVIG